MASKYVRLVCILRNIRERLLLKAGGTLAQMLRLNNSRQRRNSTWNYNKAFLSMCLEKGVWVPPACLRFSYFLPHPTSVPQALLVCLLPSPLFSSLFYCTTSSEVFESAAIPARWQSVLLFSLGSQLKTKHNKVCSKSQWGWIITSKTRGIKARAWPFKTMTNEL